MQVDAFTSQAFKGNSAAVVLLPEHGSLSDATLQTIGMENNLSETAFIRPIPASTSPQAADNFDLRWFTPTVEVDLCGHATLASAATIWTGLNNTSKRLRFQTRSGELTVEKEGEEGLMAMDFPLLRALADVPEGADKGSALVKAAVGGAAVKEVLYNAPGVFLLVVLEGGKDELLGLAPNPAELLASYITGNMRVIVTVQGSDGFDFYYRFFAPWNGIDEDPVTGSASTVAGPYWASRLGKSSLTARQLSARTGDLWIDVREDAGRVILKGHAVLVISGTLHLPPSALA